MDLNKVFQNVIDFIDPKEKAKTVPPKREFNVKNWDLANDLQEADIILFRFGGEKNFSGGVISRLTSSPYCHADIHVKNGFTIDAIASGMSYEDLYKQNIFGNGSFKNRVDIFRAPNLTREQRLIILAKLQLSLAMPYDFFNLLGFPFLSKKEALKLSANHAYICSENVAWCYHNAGLDLIADTPEAIEAPADIGHSNLLNYIGTYENGMKMKENYRNKFIDEEFSGIENFVSNFIGLFSNKDEYYEKIATNKKILKSIR